LDYRIPKDYHAPLASFYLDEYPMLEFTITTTSNSVDELSDQLQLLGASAVTWRDGGDEPVYEPLPGEIIQWQEMIVSAFFEDHSLKASLESFLHEAQKQQLLFSFTVQEVENKDWVRESLDQFAPICFGKRLWICPSWNTPPRPRSSQRFIGSWSRIWYRNTSDNSVMS